MATEDLTFRFNVTGNAVPQFQKVQQQVSRVDRQVKAASRTVAAHGQQYSRTSVQTNKWAKGALQQAGFQVGDFAVQVANGTTKMQAFGQQGSQLLGIFGPVGAILGAAVAIFSAVSVAIQKASGASQELTGDLDELQGSVSAYRSAAEKAITPTSDLEEKYGDAAEKARQLFEANAALQKLDAIDALTASAARLQEEFGDLGGRTPQQVQTIGRAFSALQSELESLRQEQLNLTAAGDMLGANEIGRQISDITQQLQALGPSVDVITDVQQKLGAGAEEATRFAVGLAKISQAETPQDLADAIDASRIAFREMAGGAENMNDEQRDLLRQLVQTSIEAMNLNAEVAQVGDSIDKAGDSTDEAAKSAGLLSLELSSAAQSALAVQSALSAAPGALEGMRGRGQVLQAEINALTAGATQLDASVEAFRKRRELELNASEAVSIAQAQAIADQINAEAEVFAANQARLNQLGELRKALTDTGSAGAGAARRVADAVNTDLKQAIENITPLEEKMQSLGKSIAGSFETAMMSAVDGTKTVAESFRSMASEIIKELYRVFVVKKITGFIEGAISGMAGPGLSSGQATSIVSQLPAALAGQRAMGGPVTGSQPYLVGERGPELFVPSRSGHIVSNDKVGGGGVTVNQTINVSTGVQQTVRTEIKSLMPQIAEGAKSAVVDAKLRGGSYGRSF